MPPEVNRDIFNYSTPVAQKPCKNTVITAGSNKVTAECYCPETGRVTTACHSSDEVYS